MSVHECQGIWNQIIDEFRNPLCGPISVVPEQPDAGKSILSWEPFRSLFPNVRKAHSWPERPSSASLPR
jgi:hypothetical protein